MQSARQQTVLSGDAVRALPASRSYGNYIAALPAIQATGFNSGAATINNFFSARGGRYNEGLIQIDGMNVGSPFNGGGVSNYVYDMGNSSEVQVSISGGLGEADRGAPSFNIIPKTGGNRFSGNVFGSWAGKCGQSSNIDDSLRALGFAERRRSSRTGTPTSPSADRSSATVCGFSPTRAPSAPTRNSRTCMTT